MAGDWIKMRVNLADDPDVIGIAAAVGLDEDHVVGKLHKLWSWADQHTLDGNAPSVTPAWVDRYVGVSGFSAALQAVGWLAFSESGVSIPDFERHNGESGKRRALTAKRASKCRTSNADRNASSNAHRNASDVTESAPREEKRREEKSVTDHIRTSWKDKDYQLQVRGIAAESFRGSPFLEPHEYREDDRRDLLAIAAIHHSGQIRPQWFLSALDAIHNRTDQKPVTAPVRLFKKILADKWPQEAEKRFGGFYKALYAICQAIPPELIKQRQQAGQEAGATQ